MTSKTERVERPLELRAEGRELSGYAMRWGEYSPSHRERFEAGSLEPEGDYWLDFAHDSERVIAYRGGGLSLVGDSEGVLLQASLPHTPMADKALAAITQGRMTGLSVEFRAIAEKRADGVRIIERAALAGVGLVEHPSYPSSRVEARHRGRLPLWAY